MTLFLAVGTTASFGDETAIGESTVGVAPWANIPGEDPEVVFGYQLGRAR